MTEDSEIIPRLQKEGSQWNEDQLQQSRHVLYRLRILNLKISKADDISDKGGTLLTFRTVLASFDRFISAFLGLRSSTRCHLEKPRHGRPVLKTVV